MPTKLDSACLVVNFRALKGWKQTSINKEASDNVTAQSGAVSNSAKVQVKLFRNEVTEAINALFTSTRRELHHLTLPTENDSQTLVPIGQWERVQQLLDNASSELAKLCGKLPAVYAQYVAAEQTRLGSLFDSRHYATAAQIASGTRFEYGFDTLPSSNRFAELFTAESIVTELSNQYESKLTKVAELAKQHLQTRVDSAIDRIVNSVRAFHHGLQTKLFAGKLCKSLQAELAQCASLNFDNDATIANLIDMVLQSLPSNPESLLVQSTAESFCNALRPIAPTVVAVQVPAVQVPAVAEPEPVAAELPAELEPVQSFPVAAELEPVQSFPIVAVAAVAAVQVQPVPVFVPVSIDDFE